MVKKKPLLIFLTVGMLALAATFWYRSGESEGVGAYLVRIQGCAEGPAPTSREEGLRIRDCIGSVLDEAYEQGAVAEVAEELDNVTRDNPWLRNSCHAAVHLVTERHALTEDLLWELLENTGRAPDCDWAFGHAAVLGLAALGPEQYQKGEILAWCRAAEGGPRVYGNCIHGVGHHAWKATGSLSESVAACDEVPESSRGSCASGVFMEMFEPATETGATYSRSEAASLVPELCKQWRTYTSSPGDECAHGAGYVYGLDVRDSAFAFIRAGEGASADAVVESLDTAIGRCAYLPGASTCENMLINSVPVDLATTRPDVYMRLCASFSDQYQRDTCERRGQVTDGSA